MKLGIVQTDPSDPDSLQIVNQETGERVDNLSWCEIEYGLDGVQTIKAEFKVCRKPKPAKPRLDNKYLDKIMKEAYKDTKTIGINDGLKPNIEQNTVHCMTDCKHHPV